MCKLMGNRGICPICHDTGLLFSRSHMYGCKCNIYFHQDCWLVYSTMYPKCIVCRKQIVNYRILSTEEQTILYILMMVCLNSFWFACYYISDIIPEDAYPISTLFVSILITFEVIKMAYGSSNQVYLRKVLLISMLFILFTSTRSATGYIICAIMCAGWTWFILDT